MEGGLFFMRPLSSIPLIILFFLLSAHAKAQKDTTSLIEDSIDFKMPNLKQENSFFMAGYYAFAWSGGKALNPTGMHFTGGINLARLFSNRLILGIGFELKGFKGLFPKRIPVDLINSFNQDLISTYLNASDSSHATVLSSAINGNGSNKFQGNYVYSAGVIFSLFPNKFGGLLLFIKRTSYSFPVFGVYDNPYFHDGSADFAYFDVPKCYGIQLTCKPAAFFRKTRTMNENDDSKYLGIIHLSIYYDHMSYKDALFEGDPLSKFLLPSFFDKYAVDNRFGIKIGLGFY